MNLVAYEYHSYVTERRLRVKLPPVASWQYGRGHGLYSIYHEQMQTSICRRVNCSHQFVLKLQELRAPGFPF